MPRISDPQDSQPGLEQKPANGKTVLIAEDDPFISRMYQTKLSSAGYKIVTANNGRDAYEQAKSSNADLIMMDINMPELSGFDVVRALKGEGVEITSSNTIILTNSANPADRKSAEDLGVDYMIKAELTPREVLDTINKKLGLQ